MELFTEINGQILSLIINIIVILIFNIKYMKYVSLLHVISRLDVFLGSVLDILINTLLLGYTFKFIHQFIYLLFRFSFLNLLLMIGYTFIIGIFIIIYMILMLYNVKFIQVFYSSYNDDEEE